MATDITAQGLAAIAQNGLTAVTAGDTAVPLLSGTNSWSGVQSFAAGFAAGFGTTSTQVPSNISFVVSPGAQATLTAPDYVAHLRQAIYTGDWTTTATVTVTATGGTAVWTIGGQSTTLAYNASAPTVQTALQGLSTVGAGSVLVSGGPGGSGGGTPYVVAYQAAYMATGGLFTQIKQLSVNGAGLTGAGASAALVWANMWGDDTGFVFAGNAFFATGTASGDGNNIGILYGDLMEVDVRSNASIGKMLGAAAEASFYTATATGHVGTLISFQASSPAHKGGANPAFGTADNVYSLYVGGAQMARTFSDGVTNSTTTFTSATAQFSGTDVGKVITATGIPANTYVAGVTNSTTLTLSAAATESATGLATTIMGTAQATTANTAYFGPGIVQANGQINTIGWRDEATLKVTGIPLQVSNLAEFWENGNLVAHIFPSGAISSNSSVTAFPGQANATAIGFAGGPSKPGVTFGNPYDTGIYRDSAGIVASGGGIRLGNNPSVTSGQIPVASGARLFSGSGAPGTITGEASGDFYFRTDTPGTANQRLYVYNGSSWTGIL